MIRFAPPERAARTNGTCWDSNHFNRQELFTLALGLESLAGRFQTKRASGVAGSLLLCVPVLALLAILHRHLVSGLPRRATYR